MNWQLNDEQRQFRDALRRMLDATYGFEQRRQSAQSERGWSEAGWKRLAEMGTTGLGIEEEAGGLGGSARDIAVVMLELGRALALEPFLASSVLSAAALRTFAQQAEVADLLPRIAAGEIISAWAHDEMDARHHYAHVRTRAEREEPLWTLSGAKMNVTHAPAAQKLIVSARVSGLPDDEAGVALFLVDPSAAGLTLRTHRFVDESIAAELTLDRVPALPLGDPFDGRQQGIARAAVRAWGMAALCSEAVGVMEAAFELTTSYAMTRQQFGKPLGANQGYRHQIAEMAVALETCRSAAAMAAQEVASGEYHGMDLLRAKLLVGLHGRALCHQAVQLHGAIGVTEEYKVGHCLRRMFVIDQMFGDHERHADELADRLTHARVLSHEQA